MNLNTYILIKEIRPETYRVAVMNGGTDKEVLCLRKHIPLLRQAIKVAQTEESESGLAFKLLS